MRKGFAMVTAIFVIVLIAGVGALILDLASKVGKTTVYQYKHEQAILLAKSYTELAIMYASANDPTVDNCAEDINGIVGGNTNTGEGYDVQVRISYIGNNLQCSTTRILASGIASSYEVQILVDVYVRYKDPDVVDQVGGDDAPWITYHRRTLQKL